MGTHSSPENGRSRLKGRGQKVAYVTGLATSEGDWMRAKCGRIRMTDVLTVALRKHVFPRLFKPQPTLKFEGQEICSGFELDVEVAVGRPGSWSPYDEEAVVPSPEDIDFLDSVDATA